MIFIEYNTFSMSKFEMKSTLTTLTLNSCAPVVNDQIILPKSSWMALVRFGSVRFGKQKVQVRFGSGEGKISGSVVS